MCCFSGKVRAVTNTRIFARAMDDGTQFIAYAMNLDTPLDVAMILPIPVKADTQEDQLKFVNFEKYPMLFDDLAKGFPAPAGGRALSKGPTPESMLKVQSVGSFDASFVPSPKDFSRLDARFRLPDGAWEKLPQYRDFGFAVFKLKQGNHSVHPLAFQFPSRHPERLFFPTVHIHDGEVHEKEKFDHSLYFQTKQTGLRALAGCDESDYAAAAFVKCGATHGMVDAGLHVRRIQLNGELKNEDKILSFS
ncbi:MAG: hypothetical protein CFE26_15965 [Verrucomicrobiales bacterium VVV1]|nr:MAG: hypothetical protein CFE26_15965 [Verrucomicrobiales bacterium VVV1]